ncbi:MAG: DUF401 family protein, partial [bacterium]
MPAVVLILLSFAVIVILMRFRVPLAAGLAAGIVVLAALAGVAPALAWKTLGKTCGNLDMVSVVLTIVLILLFSDALRLGGRLDRIVSRFVDMGPSPRARLIAFPALIGLLPMPGGAVFSAPMVEAAGRDLPHLPGQFSAINYWFRHIWEYWWPLYPGVIIAMGISGLSTGVFIASMIPYTAISVIAGLLFLFPKPKKAAGNPDSDSAEGLDSPPAHNRNGFAARPAGTVRGLVRQLAPITIVIIGGVGLELLREGVKRFGFEITEPIPRTAIILALVVSILYTVLADKIRAGNLLRDFANRKNFEMVLMVVLVLYYKDLLEAAGLVGRTVAEFQAWHVPLWGVVMLLPFLVGMITGIQIAAVGVSFPVLIGLAHGAGLPLVSVVVLAYGFAYAGMLLSPVHFCLLLTKEYFHDGFGIIYKWIAWPVAIVALGAIALAAAYG